ncbi:UNVERIFIED_CONTAM: hypothetical protein RMT77_015578 [Armadillidium vulgare]
MEENLKSQKMIPDKKENYKIIFTQKQKTPKLSSGIGVGIFACMLGSALPTGHNLGVINNPQKPIRAWISYSLFEEYNVILNSSQEYIIWGLVVSIFVGGALVGSSSGAHLANSLGRRNGLLISHLVCLVSGLVILGCQFVNVVELLLLGRLMAGLATGASTSLVPLYLSEISPPSLKGVMGTLFPLGLCLGILISQILGLPNFFGNESTWPYLVGGHFIYVLLSLPLHLFLPISPTHLYLNKSDTVAAHQALMKLRHGDVYTITKEENALFTVSLENEMKKIQGGAWKLLFDRRLFRSLSCVIVLNIGQQLAGINAVFYYSTLLFLNSGMDLEQSQGASVCAGIPNLIMAALALPLVRYVKRKRLLVISIISYCFWQIVLILCVHYLNLYPWTGKLAFVSVFAAVLCYGIGLGPIPYMIGTELFSSEVRGFGLAVGAMSNWGANLIVGLVFPLLQEKMGIYSFLIFIVVCIVLLIYVILFVPETYKKKNDYYKQDFSDIESKYSSSSSLSPSSVFSSTKYEPAD